MNTYIEWPAIHGRLLFWLSALHQEEVSGWLSWADTVWANSWSGEPLRRINGTMLTDWQPSGYGFGTNGDGYWMYPGEGARPLSSMRLENIRDGLEDSELFARLGSDRSHDVITRVLKENLHCVANSTSRADYCVRWRDDPAALEAARREAARRLMLADDGSM